MQLASVSCFKQSQRPTTLEVPAEFTRPAAPSAVCGLQTRKPSNRHARSGRAFSPLGTHPGRCAHIQLNWVPCLAPPTCGTGL